MGLYWAIGALTLLLASTVCATREESLELSRPKEVFKSDGGIVEVWSTKYQALREANVVAARAVIEPRGLGLFKYSDSPSLIFILQGNMKIGLSYPWEQKAHIRSVKKGEIIAIPRGVPHWWYNDGEEKAMGFCVSDISQGRQTTDVDDFFLVGGKDKQWGSVLHGFDEELLSEAWDVEREIVKKIRESQEGIVIIKVKKDLDIQATEHDHGQGEEKEFWEHFTFNVDEAEPDVEVRNGGTFTMVNAKKMPILSEICLGAVHVKLEKEAMCAPGYVTNAFALVYITKGSGRIQIIGTGEQLLDSDVEEGMLFAVPQLHPYVKKAGRDGLHFITIYTSSMPKLAFLAGKNAVYRNVPIDVLAASNNVDKEVEQKLLDRRRDDAVIFPPRGESGSVTESAIKKLNDLVFTHTEELKRVLENKVHIRL